MLINLYGCDESQPQCDFCLANQKGYIPKIIYQICFALRLIIFLFGVVTDDNINLREIC